MNPSGRRPRESETASPTPFDPTTYGAYQYNSSWSQAGVIGRYFKIGANFSF